LGCASLKPSNPTQTLPAALLAQNILPAIRQAAEQFHSLNQLPTPPCRPSRKTIFLFKKKNKYCFLKTGRNIYLCTVFKKGGCNATKYDSDAPIHT
jgi:hypothetical protein